MDSKFVFEFAEWLLRKFAGRTSRNTQKLRVLHICEFKKFQNSVLLGQFCCQILVQRQNYAGTVYFDFYFFLNI